ncbi:hypothetical protein ACJJTC_010404 [Scirpophaga incertulas]
MPSLVSPDVPSNVSIQQGLQFSSNPKIKTVESLRSVNYWSTLEKWHSKRYTSNILLLPYHRGGSRPFRGRGASSVEEIGGAIVASPEEGSPVQVSGGWGFPEVAWRSRGLPICLRKAIPEVFVGRPPPSGEESPT